MGVWELPIGLRIRLHKRNWMRMLVDVPSDAIEQHTMNDKNLCGSSGQTRYTEEVNMILSESQSRLIAAGVPWDCFNIIPLFCGTVGNLEELHIKGEKLSFWISIWKTLIRQILRNSKFSGHEQKTFVSWSRMAPKLVGSNLSPGSTDWVDQVLAAASYRYTAVGLDESAPST